jgi:hypothetical protein
VETSPAFHSHPTEVMWEEYSFGRLNEQEVAALEEHLLVCETCQISLEELSDYIAVMKAGAAELADSPRHRLAHGWRFVRRAAAQPLGPVLWITGLAAVGIALWLPPGPAPSKAAALVNLASFRGDVSTSHAPASRPLDLSISASDVPAAPEYRVTVVTGSGKQVWAGTPKVAEGVLSVRVPQGLEAGQYWVRLYSLESKILSEYGLLLQ